MGGPSSFWTDERVAELLAMRADGVSFRLIAEKLGIGRGAISGKLDRMGLTKPWKARPPKEKKPRKSVSKGGEPLVMRIAQKRQRIKLNAHHGIDPIIEIEIAPAQKDLDIPIDQRKSIYELNDLTCRWPIGEPGKPDFFFCGAEPCGPSVYCLRHGLIAYQPKRVISEADQIAKTEQKRRAYFRRSVGEKAA